jgi:hypothetical protein
MDTRAGTGAMDDEWPWDSHGWSDLPVMPGGMGNSRRGRADDDDAAETDGAIDGA